MVDSRASSHVHIPYGSTNLKVSVPSGSAVLSIREPQDKMSPQYFSSLLTTHLRHNNLDLSNPVIIVADKTRLCGYKTYLPYLLQVLEEFNLQKDRLRFIIAYGTHPRQSDEECIENYGAIYTQHSFIHHDCDSNDDFIDYGTTLRGTPIQLRKDIAQSSCVITMGAICHHYFAGYGGGRKLIFPGCGQRDSIYSNHGLYLDRETKRLSENCQPGIITDNPIAEDLFDIAETKQADLAIHGIMNSQGKLCDVVIGEDRQSFLKACSLHARSCEVEAPLAPIVIASCGGYPKDVNFIQSHKAIHNASMFTADKGMLLIFNECRDGIGSETFLPWFKTGGFTDAYEQLSRCYQGNGGTALAMMHKTQQLRIILVTELDETICQLIGVEKWSIDQAIEFIHQLRHPISYIPNASLLVNKKSAPVDTQ